MSEHRGGQIIIISDNESNCRSCGRPIDLSVSPEGMAICEECYYED